MFGEGMFKVGTEVVCVEPDSKGLLERGKRYTIDNVNRNGGFVNVEGVIPSEDSLRINPPWRTDRFVLASQYEPTPIKQLFKSGDRVRCLVESHPFSVGDYTTVEKLKFNKTTYGQHFLAVDITDWLLSKNFELAKNLFKAGDNVECIDDLDKGGYKLGQLYEGDTYCVQGVSSHGQVRIGDFYFWNPERFKLVENGPAAEEPIEESEEVMQEFEVLVIQKIMRIERRKVLASSQQDAIIKAMNEDGELLGTSDSVVDSMHVQAKLAEDIDEGE